MNRDVKRESLWVTRFKLWLRSFKQNWELFKERKIALYGLGVIIFFALYGAFHGGYIQIMENVYKSKTYEIAKEIYSIYESNLLDDLENAINSGDKIGYRLTLMQKEKEVDEKVGEIFRERGMAEDNEFYRNVKMVLTGKYFDYDVRLYILNNLKAILKDVNISDENIDELTSRITSYFFFEKINQFIDEFGNEEKSEIAWRYLDENKVRELLLNTARTYPDFLVEIASGYNLNYTKEFVEKNPEEAVGTILAFSKYDITPIADIIYDAIDFGKIKHDISTDEKFLSAVFMEMKDILEDVTGEVLDENEVVKNKDKYIPLILENIDIDTLTKAYLLSEIKKAFSSGENTVKELLLNMMKKHVKYSLLSDLRFNPAEKLQSFYNTFEYYDEAFYSMLGLNEVLNKMEDALNKGDRQEVLKYAESLLRKLENIKDIRQTAAIVSNWVENLKGGSAGYGKIGIDYRSADPKISSSLAGNIDKTFEELTDIAREVTDFLNTMDEYALNKVCKDVKSLVESIKKGKEVSIEEFRKALNTVKSRKTTLLSEDKEIYKKFLEKEKVLKDYGEKVIMQDVYYIAQFFSEKLSETLGSDPIVEEFKKAANNYLEMVKGKKKFNVEEELEKFNELVSKAQKRIINIDVNTVKLPEYNVSAVDLLIATHKDFQKEIKEALKNYVGKTADRKLYDELIDVAAYFDLKEVVNSFYFASLPYDPITGNDGLYNNPAPPSALHPLGTDPLGRDIMSEMMYSTPREFVLGVTAALITVIIGTLIGATAAYYGGAVDTFFMRLADIVMLFPSLALLMVLSAFMELTLFRLALIMGIISGFGSITIVLKAQALTVKVRPFIEAAKSAGGSDFYIITKHIIPNILPLSFLYMMFSVTGAIFSEAVLSFFGLVQLRMSWGIILHTAQSQGYLIGSNIGTFWWLWVPPGAAITLICSAFYFLGRGLEEIVNPRLRSR